MKTDLFQSCGHCWVFQICWHIECSTFTASFFRIWNSSTGIPSPPLSLFVVIFPKAHLTSHSKMSGSRWVWVFSPLWLTGSWRSVLYSSSVYSCHLFLISYASARSIPFLSFIEPIFTWNVYLVSLIFLRDLQSFPFYYFSLFLCIDCWGMFSYLSLLFFGTLHSNRYIYPFFLFFSLLFFSQLFVRPSQTAILLFCISFSWGWSHLLLSFWKWGTIHIPFLLSPKLIFYDDRKVPVWFHYQISTLEAGDFNELKIGDILH